jgi:hypothetical protein
LKALFRSSNTSSSHFANPKDPPEISKCILTTCYKFATSCFCC